MAHVLKPRVAETTTTTGTGALSLSAALTAHQRFNAVCSVGDTVEYTVVAVDAEGIATGDWEEGIGTYSSANTLTRTTVTASSNAGAAVSFAAGTKAVLMTPTATRVNSWSLVTASAPSAAASVTFTGLSDQFEYRVDTMLSVSAGAVDLLLLVSANGGSSWESGGTTFYFSDNAFIGAIGSGAAITVRELSTTMDACELSLFLTRPYGRAGDQRMRVESYSGAHYGLPVIVADCSVPAINAIRLEPETGTITGTVNLYRRVRQ